MKTKTTQTIASLVLFLICAFSVAHAFWNATSPNSTMSDSSLLFLAVFGLISGLASIALLHDM